MKRTTVQAIFLIGLASFICCFMVTLGQPPYPPHETIVIGMSLGIQASTTRGGQTRQYMRGVQLGLDWYKNQPNFKYPNGKEYRMELYIMENYDNKTLMMEQYNLMAHNSSVHFLLGPVNSMFLFLYLFIIFISPIFPFIFDSNFILI